VISIYEAALRTAKTVEEFKRQLTEINCSFNCLIPSKLCLLWEDFKEQLGMSGFPPNQCCRNTWKTPLRGRQAEEKILIGFHRL